MIKKQVKLNLRPSKKLLFGIITFILFTPILFSEINISGYYKSFFLVSKNKIIEGYENKKISSYVFEHLRLNFLLKASNNSSFELSYDIIPSIKENSTFFNLQKIFSYKNPYRAYDLSSYLWRGDEENSFSVNQNLDRAVLNITFNSFDLSIGRQAISWGSGKIINPTDIFSPFAFNELDKEERRGIDAIRVRIETGDFSEIDIGYVAGKRFNFNESGLFIRRKFQFLNSDFSIIFSNFKGNSLLGFDISREFMGAGLWFEWAFVKTNTYKSDTAKNSENYLRLSTGFDYSIKSVYLFFEYHYNGAGSSEVENYKELFLKEAYREGSVYLMGKHYINSGVLYQITGVLSSTITLIFNLNDRSFFLFPQIEYSVSENVYIMIGGFLTSGESPSFKSNLTSPLLHSEFGTYPDTIFSSFRVYF